MIHVTTLVIVGLTAALFYLIGRAHNFAVALQIIKTMHDTVGSMHGLITKMVEETRKMSEVIGSELIHTRQELVEIKKEQTTMLKTQIAALESFIGVMEDEDGEDEEEEIEINPDEVDIPKASAVKTALTLHTKLVTVRDLLLDMKNRKETIGPKQVDGLLSVVNYEDKTDPNFPTV